MTKPGAPISRRAALARLGLAAGAVYCSPALTHLSMAHARSGSSGPSAESGPSPASSPSPASPASPASAASAPSAPSGAAEASSGRPSGCSAPSGAERATISRSEMARANAAVARGDAQPLRDIIGSVKKEYPGRLIRVGFSTKDGRPQYQLRMVTRSGNVQTVTVDAGSGRVSGVGGC